MTAQTCYTNRTTNRGPQTVYPIVVPELGNGETMSEQATEPEIWRCPQCHDWGFEPNAHGGCGE